MNWLYSHGGPLGLILIFNMIMMGIQRVCDILKVQEPEWIKKLGKIVSSLASWASANSVAPAIAPSKTSATESKLPSA